MEGRWPTDLGDVGRHGRGVDVQAVLKAVEALAHAADHDADNDADSDVVSKQQRGHYSSQRARTPPQ